MAESSARIIVRRVVDELIGLAGLDNPAALAQTRIVLGPVRHLEFHLAYAMTAGGVMFVRYAVSIKPVPIAAA